MLSTALPFFDDFAQRFDVLRQSLRDVQEWGSVRSPCRQEPAEFLRVLVLF